MRSPSVQRVVQAIERFEELPARLPSSLPPREPRRVLRFREGYRKLKNKLFGNLDELYGFAARTTTDSRQQRRRRLFREQFATVSEAYDLPRLARRKIARARTKRDFRRKESVAA